jgi:lysophospholipase L1-like esterase
MRAVPESQRPVADAKPEPGAEPAPPRRGNWAASWTAAPQLTEPGNLPPAPAIRDGVVFAGCVLRQTLRVSAGGARLRLRFSNTFGTTDLVLGEVSVARPSGGRIGMADIEEDTALGVTFGSQITVTLRPGTQVVSDPVDFPVADGTALAVTVSLPDGQSAAGGITSHPGSRTTSYVLAPGDAVPVEHWYYLSGIEVEGSVTGVAVLLGDSLTDGRGSTTDGHDRWPDQFFRRLCAEQARPGPAEPGRAPIAVVNQGIGGNRVLRDSLGPSVLSRLDRDVLAVSGARWLVLFEGVNDIGTADATGAACKELVSDLIFGYEQIITRAHAAGLLVYGATLTPLAGNDSYDDAGGHRRGARQQVNHWIRGSGRLDAVLDFDQAVRDPRDPERLAEAFDTGDHLHLNPAGYAALADAVPADLFGG